MIINVAAYLKKIHWDGQDFEFRRYLEFFNVFIVAIIYLYMVWKLNITAFALVTVYVVKAIAVEN